MAWVKGQSGNPGGRPKKNKEVEELAQQCTVEAINRLKQIMRQQKDVKAALQAAQALLERGHGKPRTKVEMTGAEGGPIQTEHMSDTEAARRIAFALAKGVDGVGKVDEVGDEEQQEPTLQ
jgi:hypothetical protein